MFAVVDILGQQFKVFEKTDIFVHIGWITKRDLQLISTKYIYL